jgi:hypothetical protein
MTDAGRLDAGPPPDASLPDGGCAPFDSWPDRDGDLYGDMNEQPVSECFIPIGYINNGGDCDDTPGPGFLIHPNATETPADGIDQDCNLVDTCYDDRDDDGEGSTQTTEDDNLDCGDDSSQTSAFSTDCNDADATVHHGATENFHDGLDQDCLGDDDFDQDQDGYVLGDNITGDVGKKTYTHRTIRNASTEVPGTGSLPGGDCHTDNEPTAHPGGQEAVFLVDAVCPTDGLDNDCDGASDLADWDCQDRDSDGIVNGVDLANPLDRIGGAGLETICMPMRPAFSGPWDGNNCVLHGLPSGTWGGFGQPLSVAHVVVPTEIPGNPGNLECCYDFTSEPSGNYSMEPVSALGSDGVSAVNQADCNDWVRARIKEYGDCYESHQGSCSGFTPVDPYTRTYSGVGGCPSGRGLAIVVSGGVITGDF